jgi:tRNA threonylcarbamoyladenosine biosynthesis protein TsaE
VIVATTKSADDTRELAAQLAGLCRTGDIILLAGELGAGKTTFAQGFGRALGVEGPITSPTFTLLQRYDGRVPMLHADVYRLDSLQEIVDLGFPELLEEGVALIEWGDVAAPALPADFLEVRLEWTETEDERHVSVRIVGPSWAPRQRALADALSRWVVA